MPSSLQPLLRVWRFLKSSFKANRKGFYLRENPLQLPTVSVLQWTVQNGQDCKHAPLGGAGKPPHEPCPSRLFCPLVPEWDLPAQTSRTTWQFPLTWKGFPFKSVSLLSPRVLKTSSSLVLPLWTPGTCCSCPILCNSLCPAVGQFPGCWPFRLSSYPLHYYFLLITKQQPAVPMGTSCRFFVGRRLCQASS